MHIVKYERMVTPLFFLLRSIHVSPNGLMSRQGPGVLEIGYWVRADRVRRGVASAAARLLTSAALRLDGIDRVEIHHDRANVASAAVPRRLGFHFVEERPDQPEAPGDEGIECVWRMDRNTWSALAPDWSEATG